MSLENIVAIGQIEAKIETKRELVLDSLSLCCYGL